MNRDKLKKLAKSLEEEEAETLVKWIVEGLKDIGIEHNEMCLSQRPHSHSADCDCGADELNEKLLDILE